MSNITIVIDENKEKNLAKALHLLKGRKKAQAFKEALILASLNDEFINKFVNPLFKDEYIKTIKNLLNDIKRTDDIKSEETEIIKESAQDETNLVEEKTKLEHQIENFIKNKESSEDDFEEEQF